MFVAWVILVSPTSAAEILDGIKGADDRQIMVSAEYPWSAIGRVNTETGGHCTGVLVGPALVLTASHCLWDKRKHWWVPVEQVHFVAGFRDGKFVAHTTSVRYFVPPAYDETATPSGKTAIHDWAFVELKEEIGRTTGWLGVSDFTADRLQQANNLGLPFVQAGYSRDKKTELSAHMGCVLEGYLSGYHLIQHRCDAVPGDSGSPIFVFVDGLPYLTGIHVATTKLTKPVRGLAVPTETFVRGVLQKGGGAPGVPETNDQLPHETVRTMLLALGYPAEGDIRNAIRAFQTKTGLEPTGSVHFDLVGYLINALKGGTE